MKIATFKQSIFVSEDDKNLAWLTVGDWDGCNEWHMSIYIGDTCVHPRTAYNFTPSAELMLPTVDKETVITVLLEPFKENPVKCHAVLKPVKNYTIHLLNSAHEDIGYCGYANELGRGMYEYLLKAIDLAKSIPTYRYTIEHYWWLDAFEQYATETEKADLQKCFDDGKIRLNAIHAGTHTPLCGHEELIRSTYYSQKDAKKTWGISPKTALFTDVSGISSSAISIYKAAGIKYAAVCENGIWHSGGFRSAHDRIAQPLFFKWMAKNGDSLICWYQNGYGYHIPELDDLWIRPLDNFYFDETKARRTEQIINQYINELDVPYDIIPLCRYHDREIPSNKQAIVCDYMNKRWKSPKFVMSNADDFMEQVEAKYADILPKFTGELVDQWADAAVTSPKFTGLKRQAQEKLRTAETVSVINAVRDSAKYPERELDGAVWNMCEFDEHCWASSAKNPLRMHLLNHKLVKHQNAKKALAAVNGAVDDFIGQASGDKVSVWNFIPRKTEQSLMLDGFGIADAKNQLLPSGKVVTSPVSLNPYGAKVFSKVAKVERGVAITDEVIDTGFYTVTWSKSNGKIESIVEKATGHEMIDKLGSCGFGEYIFCYDLNKNVHYDKENNLVFDYARPRKISVEQGAVATVITQTSYEEQSGANVKMQATFYRDKKEIDLHITFENAAAFMGCQYDRYRKNAFIGFPFALDNFRFYTETAADIIDEQNDRLPNAPHDFVVAHRYIAVENGEHGYAIYTKDAPVFHLGGIHWNELSAFTKHENAHIYLHAAANRCNQLEYESVNDCRGEFDLSILPYTGHLDNKINLWSEEKCYSPIAGKAVPDCSMISVDKENVRFLTMKKAADDGKIVARFYEMSGNDTDFTFTLPFKVEKMAFTDIIENETTEYKTVGDNTLSLTVKANSYLTVKLDCGVEIQSKAECIEPYISELFSFEVENTDTVICFKKNNCKDIRSFEVFANGELIAVAPNDEYNVQVVEAEGLNLRNIEIKCAK